MADRLLRPDELSEMVGHSEGSLRNMRAKGVGPAYVKLGKYVRYREADVSEWLAASLVRPGER